MVKSFLLFDAFHSSTFVEVSDTTMFNQGTKAGFININLTN